MGVIYNIGALILEQGVEAHYTILIIKTPKIV